MDLERATNSATPATNSATRYDNGIHVTFSLYSTWTTHVC